MKLRYFAVSALLCLASLQAHADFPKSVKWTNHGATSASNPCLVVPGTTDCMLFPDPESAGTYQKKTFCGTANLFSGTFPNEIWNVGPFHINGNCTGTQDSTWVRQASTTEFCPERSQSSGAATCECKSGFNEAENGVGEKSCLSDTDKDNGPPCRPCGNPINPGNGNKFEREEIYRSAQGLSFSIVYNSRAEDRAGFGYRWRGFFDRRIQIINTKAVAFRHDGKVIPFVASGGAWAPDDDVAHQLTELTSGGVRTGWELVLADGDELETYDAAGKLTAIMARSGVTQTLAYSDGTKTGTNGAVYLHDDGTSSGAALPAGMLIRVTEKNRAMTFAYYVSLNLGRMTRPGGGDYKFSYDLEDRLTSITYPDTRVKTFVYNESAHTGGVSQPYALTGIIDENGDRYATFAYDAQGRAVSTQHAGGVDSYIVAYNTNGSADVTDPRGVTRTYGFQTLFNSAKPTGITGSPCATCGPASQTLDANGNVATRIDWNGNRTNYTFDLARNLETARTEGLTSAGGTTPQTRTITTEWHSTFRLPTRIAEPLRITTNTYDGDGSVCGVRGGLCSRSLQATTDASGSLGYSATTTGTARTWTYTYNANGDVLTVNGPRTDATDVTTITYYAESATCAGVSPSGCRTRPATITNAAGHVTTIDEYAPHGEPLKITDPNGLVTTLAYDARQRLTSRTVGGETTTYTYDFAGQLTRVTLPDSSYLEYTYDDAHRITATQDNLGNRIAYTLDDMGNRTLEEVRDPSNNLVQTRGRVYSNLNRLFQELGASSQTTEYTYDDQGNVLTVNGPRSGTVDLTTNQYDALNRLKQVTDPNSGVTQYAYNGLDALTQVTDPRSLATSYTLDGLGNLAQQASPDTGTTVNTYDAAGNLLTQTDAKSQVTTYAYDVLNRVTQITFHDGSKQIYGYDSGTNGKGRLTGIEERNASNVVTSQIAYVYDQRGRVTSETRTVAGLAYALGYRYDSSGRLDQLTYPSGRTVNYSFDSLGRISGVTTTPSGGSAQAIVSSVAYHPFGGVKSYTLGNGQSYARSYDQDGRISSYTLGAQSFAIGYDVASRIEFISDLGNPSNSNSYGYDNLDRLTSALVPSVSYSYGYDGVGNRTSRTAGSSTDTYAYSTTSNRISSITPPSGPVRNFTLDANGSTTADGINTYTYDARGRMVSATSSLGTTTYQVNALGQRMRKTNSTVDRLFHYDLRGKLIAETDPGGSLKRELFYLGDIPVAVFQ